MFSLLCGVGDDLAIANLRERRWLNFGNSTARRNALHGSVLNYFFWGPSREEVHAFAQKPTWQRNVYKGLT